MHISVLTLVSHYSSTLIYKSMMHNENRYKQIENVYRKLLNYIVERVSLEIINRQN